MFIVENPQVVIKIGDRFYNWATASPIIASLSIFHKLPNPSAMDKIDNLLDEISTPKDSYSYRSAISSWFSRSNSNQRSTSATPTTPSKTLPTHLKTQTSTSPLKPKLEPLKPIQNYAKALRLSSDELKSLNLNPGSNTITFTVASSLYGSVLLSAKIFLWDWDSKVVISDIDGTITKSDALGHLFHMVGKDWTHSGVASLYTNITKNGYKILYLTSRAIGQASTTRDYLKKVEQGDVKLPEGPMIMSPDRLFRAFHREVILRKPEEFKIACLKDVKRLFRESSPFYAGFGNRITDAISYKKVDVPVSRIFTIDPSGKIQLDLLPGYESSYIMLNDLVDQIFRIFLLI